MGQGFWENGCTAPPFFAPTLGHVKCSILHGDWRFQIFFKFFFPEFRVQLDLHIHPLGFLFLENLKSLKIPQDLLVL
jgi:hypothetical protein